MNNEKYQAARRLMDDLSMQDARVLSIMQTYKSELVRPSRGKISHFQRFLRSTNLLWRG